MDVITDRDVIAANISSNWQIEENAISKVVQFADFASALAFVNRVAEIAEEMNHHPDIDLHYDTVTLHCSTHYLGGITQYDLELAARIDELSDAAPN